MTNSAILVVVGIEADLPVTTLQIQLDASAPPFGRHPTGSAIQRLMSDSCQPVPLALIFS